MEKPVILCVDDESIILDSLKEQLQNTFGDKFDIETSDTGKEALEFLDELIIDKVHIPIVIADYIMPGMKGDEFLKQVHIISPETHNVLLTGQADLTAIGNTVNYAKLYRYISKPWHKEDLILTIKEAVKSYNNNVKIKEQNKELAELNADLEKKVELRTKELSEVNATKDKFFSIIAHDLKNPFNAMIGITEILMEDYDSFDDASKKDLIKDLNFVSTNTSKLLHNLLEWSRAQTGRIDLNQEIFELDSIVNDNISLLKAQADNKKITLFSEVKNTKVICDKNMITTVIRNLISNALKFTNNNGEVKVCANYKGDFVEVAICDNGVGIDETSRKKLFKINEKVKTPGTANEEGTGLGLLLCKEFIEKNGGKIWVESEIGKGSQFKFTVIKAE
ncbi:MAG: hybrid sensor histidine kinase/response regulator [Saprospiraceae bacterium]|nr:hybrid sensor histidine kinase/response regulator [Saprospiraceae bacterium]